MHLSVYNFFIGSGVILSLLSGLTFVIGSLFLHFAKFKDPNNKSKVRLGMVSAAKGFGMSILLIVLAVVLFKN